MTLPRLLDSLISINCGGCLALAASRVVRLSKDPKKEEERRAKFGGAAKALGLIVVLYGIHLFAAAFSL
jgi:hypothetical protein